MSEERKESKLFQRVPKGEFGYFSSEKKKRVAVTVILFLIPLTAYFIGWAYFKTRLTVVTVIVVVGCLPACRSAVSMIMILLRKPMEKALYDRIHSHQGELVLAYELYLTSYEKSGGIDAVAVCGNQVVGYSSDEKADLRFLEGETQKILRKNGYGVKVKFFRDLNPFLDRLDSMNEHREALHRDIPFQPDEKYPDLTRDELIKHTILAIAL